jgi:hypothetical protein
MTAARHIPSDHPHTETANFDVAFTYTGGSTIANSKPAFKNVSPGDTVNFSNASSTATIVITFAANPPNVANPGPPLFGVTSITLAPGANSLQTVLSTTTDGSVNYFVSVNGVQVGGPYAIQVGNGPLYVTIGNNNTNPDPVAVPPGGTLEMYSTDTKTYHLHWTTTGNPFPTPAPGLLTVNPANNIPYTNTPKTIAIYAYSFPTTKESNGGGTIKIGGA